MTHDAPKNKPKPAKPPYFITVPFIDLFGFEATDPTSIRLDYKKDPTTGAQKVEYFLSSRQLETLRGLAQAELEKPLPQKGHPTPETTVETPIAAHPREVGTFPIVSPPSTTATVEVPVVAVSALTVRNQVGLTSFGAAARILHEVIGTPFVDGVMRDWDDLMGRNNQVALSLINKHLQGIPALLDAEKPLTPPHPATGTWLVLAKNIEHLHERVDELCTNGTLIAGQMVQAFQPITPVLFNAQSLLFEANPDAADTMAVWGEGFSPDTLAARLNEKPTDAVHIKNQWRGILTEAVGKLTAEKGQLEEATNVVTAAVQTIGATTPNFEIITAELTAHKQKTAGLDDYPSQPAFNRPVYPKAKQPESKITQANSPLSPAEAAEVFRRQAGLGAGRVGSKGDLDSGTFAVVIPFLPPETGAQLADRYKASGFVKDASKVEVRSKGEGKHIESVPNAEGTILIHMKNFGPVIEKALQDTRIAHYDRVYQDEATKWLQQQGLTSQANQWAAYDEKRRDTNMRRAEFVTEAFSLMMKHSEILGLNDANTSTIKRFLHTSDASDSLSDARDSLSATINVDTDATGYNSTNLTKALTALGFTVIDITNGRVELSYDDNALATLNVAMDVLLEACKTKRDQTAQEAVIPAESVTAGQPPLEALKRMTDLLQSMQAEPEKS
jgi:hypothetical protein